MTGILLGLSAALGWGVGDFYGGVVSRRWPPLLVVLGSMTLATLCLLGVLLLRGGTFDIGDDLSWAMAAGALGVFSLTGFFRLLARGNMAVSARAHGPDHGHRTGGLRHRQRRLARRDPAGGHRDGASGDSPRRAGSGRQGRIFFRARFSKDAAGARCRWCGLWHRLDLPGFKSILAICSRPCSSSG